MKKDYRIKRSPKTDKGSRNEAIVYDFEQYRKANPDMSRSAILPYVAEDYDLSPEGVKAVLKKMKVWN